MLYQRQRRQIIQVIEDLAKFHYLDPAGGDFSVRVGANRVLSTPTGSAFRRWRVKEEDFVVMDLEGRIIERGEYLAPVETPLVLDIYKHFSGCAALAHCHSPYASVFASLNMEVPSTTNLMDTLGSVPCFYAKDNEIKARVLSGKIDVKIPEAMVQRPEVAAIFLKYTIPQLHRALLPRKEELKKHGLAFVLYKHGLFVFASDINEAVENLTRVEFSARVAVNRSFIELNKKMHGNK